MNVPKAELHCHLEGAAPPGLALAKAVEHGVAIEDLITPDGESYVWSDFTSFLAAYDRIAGLFRTPQDHFDLAYAHFAGLASQGAVYAEVFLSPDHMVRNGDYADLLDAVIAGYLKANSETGIEGRFIPVAVRNFGPAAALAAARLAVRHSRPQVTGFGLAGDERQYAPADFAPAFAVACEAGLSCTAHAGELCGSESVRQAVDDLPIRRVGHGVRAVDDPELVSRLADQGIVLEVCPGSNIALGLYPDLESHPLKQLIDAGVTVTLNSDDPPFFRTDLRREYDAVGALGLSVAELAGLTRNALEAAFIDDGTRERLLRDLSTQP